jgi:hypothetical protein
MRALPCVGFIIVSSFEGPYSLKSKCTRVFGFILLRIFLTGTDLEYKLQGSISHTCYILYNVCIKLSESEEVASIGGCIQKFPDWPPRARTASGTTLCHEVQLYRYFVN